MTTTRLAILAERFLNQTSRALTASARIEAFAQRVEAMRRNVASHVAGDRKANAACDTITGRTIGGSSW